MRRFKVSCPNQELIAKINRTHDIEQELRADWDFRTLIDEYMDTVKVKEISNLFILSDSSGTGKNKVYEELEKIIPEIQRVITATTRPARTNEKNAVDYYFVSREEFIDNISNDKFVEFNEYDGNYYGMPKCQIDSINSNPLILIIDTNGMKKVVEQYPGATSIFLMPPSLAKLSEILKSRNQNTAEEIKNRLDIAKKEIQNSNYYDYIVVNDDLEKCVKTIAEIINQKMEVEAWHIT